MPKSEIKKDLRQALRLGHHAQNIERKLLVGLDSARPAGCDVVKKKYSIPPQVRTCKNSFPSYFPAPLKRKNTYGEMAEWPKALSC